MAPAERGRTLVGLLRRAWVALRQRREGRRADRALARLTDSDEDKGRTAREWLAIRRSPTNPRVGCIVTCHDDWPLLADQLLSLRAQTRSDFELVIVDDASSERRSVEMRERLAAESPAGAKLVLLSRNVGLAGARNRGVAATSAPFVVCLDADDVLAPDFLERTIAVLERRSDVGFVYFDHFEFGAVRRHVRSRDFRLEDLLRQNFVVAAAPFRRAAWEQCGGYLEEMTRGYEDWEFWVRLAEAGWLGHRIRRTLFYYRKRPESLLAETLQSHDEIASFIRARHAGSSPVPPRARAD